MYLETHSVYNAVDGHIFSMRFCLQNHLMQTLLYRDMYSVYNSVYQNIVCKEIRIWKSIPDAPLPNDNNNFIILQAGQTQRPPPTDVEISTVTQILCFELSPP